VKGATSHSLKQRNDELQLKNTLLKIHLNALYAIQASKSLKDWVRIKIDFDKIDMICPRNIQIAPNSHIVGDVQFILEKGKKEVSRSLPAQSLQDSEIVYGGKAPPYLMNYNPVMTKERALEVKLGVVDRNGRFAPLGQILIPVSQLHQHSITEHNKDFHLQANPHENLTSARVCLRVQIVPPEAPDYIGKKREDARKKLKDVTEWIIRYQKDLEAYNQRYNKNLKSLGADVKIANTKATLLHAGECSWFCGCAVPLVFGFFSQSLTIQLCLQLFT